MTDRLHTAREIAEHLGISERGVLRMALRGEIPAFRVRRVWRFDLDQVLATLRTPQHQAGGGR